jgi:hypothetical protein
MILGNFFAVRLAKIFCEMMDSQIKYLIILKVFEEFDRAVA